MLVGDSPCVRRVLLASIALAFSLGAGSEELYVVPGIAGRSGGNLIFAQRTEPKTLNPVMAADAPSREVIHRMTADLIHINRLSGQTEPALAKKWTASPDGLRYTLELRRGLRFSDGQPFDADDVVFTFQVFLDEKVHSPQRDLLILNGKPIAVRKLDAWRVLFVLPQPYAVAERLFDGFAILPRHLLERVWREGRIPETWNLGTPPAQIAGLGPFRLKEYVPGQRLVLERNPYYWKADRAGNRLPYLAGLRFQVAGSEDMQVLRFQSGESDIIGRVSARNYGVLAREQERRGYTVRNAGSGLEYSFLFFNLNDLSHRALPLVATHQSFFRRRGFRQAVSLAIDRDAIVRLVYMGFATPLSAPVPPAYKAWLDPKLPKLVRSVGRARNLLESDGFRWSPGGDLMDPGGKRVEFSLITSAGNPDRVQMATLIQDDLKALGMDVHVVPLEFRSLVDRVFQSRDYEACLMALASADADPNVDMPVWLSSGGTHLWSPGQPSPATPWEAEIDGLMRRQIVTRKYPERKRLFDRVQEVAMDNLPLIPLVSPNILVGAKKDLGNFRPAVLDHYTLWNVEELYWRGGNGAHR
jgi:peptide/nickel transport system substrate-binding protein